MIIYTTSSFKVSLLAPEALQRCHVTLSCKLNISCQLIINVRWIVECKMLFFDVCIICSAVSSRKRTKENVNNLYLPKTHFMFDLWSNGMSWGNEALSCGIIIHMTEEEKAVSQKIKCRQDIKKNESQV